MRRLKQLREEWNLTQAALADRVGTTQQTVGRWETGKAKPNISTLRDLALLFQTSVDDLLGQNPNSNKVVTTFPFIPGRNDISDGFWGHIGLLSKGLQNTKWYPVSIAVVERLERNLANLQSGQWVQFDTLNNRVVACRPTSLAKLYILDDAADPVEGDWELRDDEYQGMPLEIYRYLADSTLEEPEASSDFKQIARNFLERMQLTEDDLYEFLHYTRFHFTDGRTDAMWVEPENLSDFLFDADSRTVDDLIKFTAFGGAPDVYLASEQLCIIDMPLIDANQGIKAVHEEMEKEMREVQKKTKKKK
jgi:DNA-binding XRE family transcriptional regulator